MKKLLFLFLACSAFLPVVRATTLKDLPADKFRAAGLHKLTEAELAALEATLAELTGEKIQTVKTEAQAAVAAAEARTQEAEKKVQTPAKAGPSWFSALLTLEKAGKTESEELQSRLKGTLKSFEGRRNFTLQNGQVWQMLEAGSYSGPAYESPEVFIRPGAMGTYWLRIPDGALRVKVKPLKLE